MNRRERPSRGSTMRSRSSGPRNRKAAAASARARELIRQALLAHTRAHPLSRPLTATELCRVTGLPISERRVQQHVASIRIEQQFRELLAEYFASTPGADPSPTPLRDSTTEGRPQCL